MAVSKNSGKAISPYVAESRVHIAYVDLKLADMERALGFYCGVLEFKLSNGR